MTPRFRFTARRLATFAAALGCAAAITASAPDAEACGGCFVPATSNTVVTGHRMVLSISPVQTVLWDQIQYAGDPDDFSWVLPVKPGARIEVANDAFFEVLEAGTQTTVQAPPEGCATGGGNGFGCSSAEFASLSDSGASNVAGNGVVVLSEGSVGPYETVTLQATDPNALATWLTDNGYSLPDSIKPTVDAYVAESFNFIALKLAPDKGVNQMTPVRIVTPGGSPTLPLRMVAAGVSNTVSVVLYVIGEGRYETKDFESVEVPPSLVTWNFESDESDYGKLRLAALAQNDGRSWLTAYAEPKSMFEPVQDQIGFGGTVRYTAGSDPNGFGGVSSNTLAEAYLRQGIANGDATDDACSDALDRLSTVGNLGSVVVDPCEDEVCGEVGMGEIDARTMACAGLDDVAVAVTGMHPMDVRITRLEAELPVAALDSDLTLQASMNQSAVHHRFQAGLKVNACWDSEPASALLGNTGGKPPIKPRDLGLLTLGALAAALVRRRRKRVLQGS